MVYCVRSRKVLTKLRPEYSGQTTRLISAKAVCATRVQNDRQYTRRVDATLYQLEKPPCNEL